MVKRAYWYGTVRTKCVTLTRDNYSIILEVLRHIEHHTWDSLRSSLTLWVIHWNNKLCTFFFKVRFIYVFYIFVSYSCIMYLFLCIVRNELLTLCATGRRLTKCFTQNALNYRRRLKKKHIYCARARMLESIPEGYTHGNYRSTRSPR